MKRLKAVLAGCGSMGGRWLDDLKNRDEIEFAALVDISAEQAQTLNRKHGWQLPIWGSVAEAVRNTGANLLLDTSVPDAHAANAITAMELGCDVVMEKPMATNMEDARTLIAVSRQTGRTCAVMQNRRYTKEIRSLKQDLDEGIIGLPQFVSANFYMASRFGGFREMMDHPLVLDMAIHTFDAARYLIGSEPVSVYCHEFNPRGSWYRGDAAASCIFEFANGAVFTYNGSWCSHGFATSWEGTWRIAGERGTAIWDGDHLPQYEYGDSNQPDQLIGRQGELHWHGDERRIACLNEMLGAVLEGKRSETDIRDNIYSIAMVICAIESARRGVKVEIRV